MRARWPDIAIVLLALALRVISLDIKPVHFDEGVNGWLVDEMTRQGFYHYDPGFFHGPLHFYALFPSLRLAGRNLWAMRLPIVLVSTLCVVVVLAYRRYLPMRACRLAALAMAISPGCVFYGRYSIHESWQLLFLLVAVWGFAGLWRNGDRLTLWVTGLALTGMVLTKETYVIHWVTFALAAPSLLWLERLSPSAPIAPKTPCWGEADVRRVFGVCALLIFFFYTGALLDWSSLPGLWETFPRWAQIGTAGKSGHEKSWNYFLELLARYEWPALLGLGASLGVLRRRTDRLVRYLAIYGGGALAAYSLVTYKTPWCLISLIWPFFFLFGLAGHRLMETLDRRTIGVCITLVCAGSLGASCLLNFREFTNEDEPYVYVQTLPDMEKVLAPLRQLTARDACHHHLSGRVLMTDHHPLLWLLGDFTHVEFLAPDAEPPIYDAAFLLVDEPEAERVERQLAGRYFRETLRLRGNANDLAVLYLHAPTFAEMFPGRVPEFTP